MAGDSPSATVKRSSKFVSAMRTSDDESSKGGRLAAGGRHGSSSSSPSASSLLKWAGAAALACFSASAAFSAHKLASSLAPHPGHAQLKALVTDGKWRQQEIDHLYELGDAMEEAIGLVSFEMNPRLFFSLCLSLSLSLCLFFRFYRRK